MKTAILVTMSMFVLAVAGCQSSPGGGMGSQQSFKIVVPLLGETMKQGETKMVNVSLNRGKYFKEDVQLDMRASKGLTVEPTKATVKASDKPEVSLKITAPKDAALGDYKIYIKGTPSTGEPTSMDFTVKVVAP